MKTIVPVCLGDLPGCCFLKEAAVLKCCTLWEVGSYLSNSIARQTCLMYQANTRPLLGLVVLE